MFILRNDSVLLSNIQVTGPRVINVFTRKVEFQLSHMDECMGRRGGGGEGIGGRGCVKAGALMNSKSSF